MLDWLRSWWRGSPTAALPDVNETVRRAPRTDAVRPGPAARPRYAFTSLDAATARRSARPGEAAAEEAPALGIDLGTTHATAAVVLGRSIITIPNQEGDLRTPCVVARTDGGDWLVGEPARRQAVSNAMRTHRGLKRRLGSPTQEDHPPEALVAQVLRKLRDAAEAHLGRRVRRAVIAVPALFDDIRRQAVIDAAHIAGFDEWVSTDRQGTPHRQRMRLIAEASAAALAFGLTTARTRSATVAVLHLGGGSFGISVIQGEEGVFQVLAAGGDPCQGGDDLDAALVRRLAAEVRSADVDLLADAVAHERLRAAAEQARIDLSSAEHAQVCLPFLAATPAGPLNLDVHLARGQLEESMSPFLATCAASIRAVLAAARLQPSAVDGVVLTGGLARTPCVARLVREVFGRDASRTLHADELIAAGAAIHAQQLALADRSEILLVDVAPLALAVQMPFGGETVIIPANTTLPVERRERLSLPASRRPVCLAVVQQSPRDGWRRLGEVTLAGVSDQGHGGGQVEVTFALGSGILDVTLRDMVGGATVGARMFPRGGLSLADVERLHREAEQEQLLRHWRG